MGARDQKRLAVVESRWKKWEDRPHPGEVFVGRRNEEVFPARGRAEKGGVDNARRIWAV